MANKLVIDKVKDAIGMDQLLVAATGAAPISVATLEFFASLGIPIYEGFGMSETSGVATCGEQGKARFGTVGRALSCCEVQIAADGEILLKGINMTTGYLHMPERTAELLDDDGWLHTGDLGSRDDDGYLKITGRKKDLIITAGGKNVAPAELEGYLRQIAGVGQAVVVGDRQPYLCALLTLDPEGIDALCERVGIDNSGLESVSVNVEVREYVEAQIEVLCNGRVAPYQTIKKFEILPLEFSVETDELTPTMKLKRNVVNEKFAAQIAAFYS
jgi:long-subunit acyl-CoA synthetase (AMP-forming)